MSSSTIRGMIDQKIDLLRHVDQLSPQQIAQESIELSSLLASVRVELVGREMAFNQKLKSLLEIHGSAPKAKIHAMASEVYKELIEAKAYLEATIELVRTTKRHTSLAEQELRETPR